MRRTYITIGVICGVVVAATAFFGWHHADHGFLNNEWWTWFLSTYTVTILAVIGAVVFILKLAAIMNPKVPSNQIIDLITETFGTTGEFPKVPGK